MFSVAHTRFLKLKIMKSLRGATIYIFMESRELRFLDCGKLTIR